MNDIDIFKKNLYSAVIADTLDSLGYHKQVLTPGITSLDPNVKICGLARVGLYMPIYHDDEHVNVYEHEIALVDSLKENEVASKYPEDLISLIRRAMQLRNHLTENKKDLSGKAGLQRIESKIYRIAAYYRKTGVLPKDWKYRPENASVLLR